MPEHPIEHKTYTEEERLAWREELLANWAGLFGLSDPPEVELVRWTTTLADFNAAINDCRTAAGFPSKVDYTGGTSFDPGVPESQEDALNLAVYVCNAQ